jgi:hypothetical protein
MDELKLLLHGMGNQDPQMKWFDDAIITVPATQKEDWAPFYWEPFRNPPTADDLKNGRQISWQQWAALSSLMDLIGYADVRDAVFEALTEAVKEAKRPVVLVAHSLGSVLAYEWLMNGITKTLMDTGEIQVVRLVTFGSPLGRQPVSGRVKDWLGVRWWEPLPSPPCEWVNLYGTKDMVTSWFRGGGLKEADVNFSLEGAGHDLAAYVAAYIKLEGILKWRT